jgi:hypothetical protein
VARCGFNREKQCAAGERSTLHTPRFRCGRRAAKVAAPEWGEEAKPGTNTDPPYEYANRIFADNAVRNVRSFDAAHYEHLDICKHAATFECAAREQ